MMVKLHHFINPQSTHTFTAFTLNFMDIIICRVVDPVSAIMESVNYSNIELLMRGAGQREGQGRGTLDYGRVRTSV